MIMTKREGTTLRVGGLGELSAVNATTFRDETRAALDDTVTTLDIDLSTTTFLDSSGLGALIALHKTMVSRGGSVRVVRPTPMALQVLELTRLHRVLEIIKP